LFLGVNPTQVLCGTVIHSKTSFALLQLSQKSGSSISCDEVACSFARQPYAALRANRILVLFLLGSHHSQVFNSIVVFSEGYVEDESGARVPLPPDFLKTGAAAADVFNDLPRTCEKVPVVKRSAEEDNDNERCDSA
jgi:hypothetical protein